MDAKLLADILQKIAAIFAFLVGGTWVLMNYIRNRTHVPRLQIDVKAEIIEHEHRRYLLTTLQIRNLGLSIIRFDEPVEEGAGPRGCALLIETLDDYGETSAIVDSNWRNLRAFDVLVHHSSIEPGLAINEQRLMHLPRQDYDAFRVRLRVLAHRQSWSAVAIAMPEVGANPAVN